MALPFLSGFSTSPTRQYKLKIDLETNTGQIYTGAGTDDGISPTAAVSIHPYPGVTRIAHIKGRRVEMVGC